MILSYASQSAKASAESKFALTPDKALSGKSSVIPSNRKADQMEEEETKTTQKLRRSERSASKARDTRQGATSPAAVSKETAKTPKKSVAKDSKGEETQKKLKLSKGEDGSKVNDDNEVIATPRRSTRTNKFAEESVKKEFANSKAKSKPISVGKGSVNKANEKPLVEKKKNTP